MTIQELYYDERFNNVVYFLSECGFSSLEDLKDFDFDELLFVPGVSEEIIEDVKKLYVDIQNVQEQKADRETANEKDFRTLSAEVIKPIPLSVNFSKDIELQNIFLQCTDSLRAIFKRVSSQDQIVGFRSVIANMEPSEDIDKSVLLSLCDGLDKHFQEKSDAPEFISYSAEEETLLRAVSIETIFAKVKRGGAMIRYCNENGLSTLWDLRDFDFSHKKIKGLGRDTAEVCKNAYKLAVDQAINPVSVESGKGTDPVKQFLEMYTALKDSARNCLLLKAQGQTLQEIGESIGVTRERVRQIIAKRYES